MASLNQTIIIKKLSAQGLRFFTTTDFKKFFDIKQDNTASKMLERLTKKGVLKKLAKKVIKDSMVLINIENIKREIWLALDRKAIEKDFKKVFILELRPSFYQKKGKYSGKTHIDDLPIEFDNFIKNLKKSEKEKDLIKKLGMIYLQKAQTENL